MVHEDRHLAQFVRRDLPRRGRRRARGRRGHRCRRDDRCARGGGFGTRAGRGQGEHGRGGGHPSGGSEVSHDHLSTVDRSPARRNAGHTKV
ncbi:hypothetical protein UO65_0791 [Actinokineospora spheciospongiae]|uniref:Uncharacterized protein n=1 Tax=Actinokineospora spheciospongiae TaxID=909613 RepID=W7J4H3_9PSEU|nr:hypothetical protein UO65_0791 [Actinokineospora spheciospongiae]